MGASTSAALTKAALKTVHPPPRLTATFPLPLVLPLTHCYSSLVRTEKQKLTAATNIDALMPPVFQSYENASLQLPVVQVQPLAAAASAQAFATGAVAVALPAQPRALLQPTSGHSIGLLQHGGRLMGP